MQLTNSFVRIGDDGRSNPAISFTRVSSKLDPKLASGVPATADGLVNSTPLLLRLRVNSDWGRVHLGTVGTHGSSFPMLKGSGMGLRLHPCSKGTNIGAVFAPQSIGYGLSRSRTDRGTGLGDTKSGAGSLVFIWLMGIFVRVLGWGWGGLLGFVLKASKFWKIALLKLAVDWTISGASGISGGVTRGKLGASILVTVGASRMLFLGVTDLGGRESSDLYSGIRILEFG